MVEVIVGILTVIVSYFGGVILVRLNWPDAPTVVAIAFMGSVILWHLRHNREDGRK